MKIDEMLKNRKQPLLYPQMGGMGIQLVPYTMYQIFEDGEKQLEVAKRIEEVFPSDFIYPMDLGMAFLESLGVPLKKMEYDFPITKKGVVDTTDQVKNLPDVSLHNDKIIVEYMKGLGLIAKQINKPVMAAVVGPFTMAGELAGISHWLRMIIKDDSCAGMLLDYCSKYVFEMIKETIDNGADVVQISEPSCSFIRPAYFENKIVPVLREMFNYINQSCVSALHICGDIKKQLPGILRTGCNIIGIDQKMSMQSVMECVPETTILAGNIDPVATMLQGRREDVCQRTEELLGLMKGHRNFMLSFGCDCPVDTPIENLKAVVHTLESWRN